MIQLLIFYIFLKFCKYKCYNKKMQSNNEFIKIYIK